MVCESPSRYRANEFETLHSYRAKVDHVEHESAELRFQREQPAREQRRAVGRAADGGGREGLGADHDPLLGLGPSCGVPVPPIVQLNICTGMGHGHVPSAKQSGRVWRTVHGCLVLLVRSCKLGEDRAGRLFVVLERWPVARVVEGTIVREYTQHVEGWVAQPCRLKLREEEFPPRGHGWPNAVRARHEQRSMGEAGRDGGQLPARTVAPQAGLGRSRRRSLPAAAAAAARGRTDQGGP